MPLFSKVLQSFLMDRLNQEVEHDPTQYGGIKRYGTEHRLIQAWDSMMKNLEDNQGSVNFISIDYAKVINTYLG